MLLGRRVHRQPHLTAIHARIHVREPEQRTRIVRLKIDDLVIVARTYAQVAIEWRVTADLAGQGKAADAATAARHLQIQAAQGLAVVASDRADFNLQVQIHQLLPALIRR